MIAGVLKSIGALGWLWKAVAIPAVLLGSGWYVVDKIGDVRERKLRDAAARQLARKNEELAEVRTKSDAAVAAKDAVLSRTLDDLDRMRRDRTAPAAVAATPDRVTKAEADALRRLLDGGAR
jgi:hypothetical protein